jgi:hypothetical protein
LNEHKISGGLLEKREGEHNGGHSMCQHYVKAMLLLLHHHSQAFRITGSLQVTNGLYYKILFVKPFVQNSISKRHNVTIGG